MRALFFILLISFGLCSKSFAAKVLLVRYEIKEMQMLSSQVQKHLKNHEFSELILQGNESYENFAQNVKKSEPDVLALLDNQTIAFAERYLKEDSRKKPLYAAATMGLNLKTILKDKAGICGIAYEVPPFSVLTRFRSYAKRPVQTVLAPYRKSEFGPFIEEAVDQLAKVQIKLLPVDMDSFGNEPRKIDDGLRQLLQESYEGQRIDAILIPTDNVLINQNNLQKVWLKKAKELSVPFLCNVESWASQSNKLCSFAAYPDIEDLGRQFADQILQIVEAGQSPGELGVEYIIAAKDKLNLGKLKELKIELDEAELSQE